MSNIKNPGREIYLFEWLLNKKIPSFTLCDYQLEHASKKNLSHAKKVSAFYMNDLIERYIKYKISYGKWPNQCENIDEYIFKRNIAPLIDEKGTAETFKIAYLNAIKVVCQSLETKKNNDSLLFSNNEQNLLAHANFLKFVLPEQLQFLKMFKYNPLQAYNSSMDIQVLKQSVLFDSAYNRSSPYQGLPYFVRNNGIIDENTVKIMEKRIGKIE